VNNSIIPENGTINKANIGHLLSLCGLKFEQIIRATPQIQKFLVDINYVPQK